MFLKQHGHQDDIERRLAGQIGPGGRMPARGGEEGVQDGLIFLTEGAPIASPGVDFLSDELGKGGKRPPHYEPRET